MSKRVSNKKGQQRVAPARCRGHRKTPKRVKRALANQHFLDMLRMQTPSRLKEILGG